MATRGVVRLWTEEGWGVIDSPETPGGCWTMWVHVMVPGFRELTAGQQVELEWEAPGQDGYDFRAVRTWPLGSEPVDDMVRVEGPSDAYSTKLTVTFDEPGASESR